MSEVLRYYSPTWLFTRRTTADAELGGHRIPAGTDVLYSPYIVNRAPASHEQARTFDPDRWAPERAACMHAAATFRSAPAPASASATSSRCSSPTLMVATIAQRWSLAAVPGTSRDQPQRARSNSPLGPSCAATRRDG